MIRARSVPGIPGRFRALAAAGVLAAWGTAATAPAATAAVDVPAEIQCLALTMYFEARGEPDEGKLAVGHVVMNRTLHPLFPDRVCDVVRQGGDKLRYRCQFTWWCDGLSDQPRDQHTWLRVKALARRVYWGYSRDPTKGALWYHSLNVLPDWRLKLSPATIIGNHVFYRLDPGEDKALTEAGITPGKQTGNTVSPRKYVSEDTPANADASSRPREVVR